jgi:uncharacterized protein
MRLGTGIGWRPEIAAAVEALPGVDWVEVVSENICPGHLPESLVRLRERGVRVVPHGVSLGLGGAARPDPARLAALAERAVALGAPLVTEHIAFVRAGGPLTASPGLEAGHLLPVPRTRESLRVLCENVRIAQDSLPVPLALENIAALFTWPGEELSEGRFLAELVERTGVRLLIDVANLHTNRVNRGEDPVRALRELPVESVAYVHVAGGVERDGIWHDTHTHPVTEPVLDVLRELVARAVPPGVLLERDGDFPPAAALSAELDAIRAVVAAAPARAASGPAAVPAGDGATAARPAGAGSGATAVLTAHRAAAPADAPADAPARTGGPDGAATAPAGAPATTTAPEGTAGERQRLGLAQTALLSALVAGTPAPEGFDPGRLRAQSRALARKRRDIVARVAPELPPILGPEVYRREFLAYARSRPLTAGHRRDALAFTEHLLVSGEGLTPETRRKLTAWWRERVDIPPVRRTTRIVRAARAVLTGRQS